MKKVVIVGATSGIGRELAKMYASHGALVGVTGRRQDLLYTLQVEFPNNIVTECFDVTEADCSLHLESLVNKMEGMDLLIYNSGYGAVSERVDWQIEKRTVDTNVNGFMATIEFGLRFFLHQGSGHLVTTSSIASIRGGRFAPAYNASKAFQSVYFEGLYLQLKKQKLPIYITDIEPGFVDTKMAQSDKVFWVASPRKAAEQMLAAIEKKKWRVYITRRWWIVAKLFKYVPSFIYHRIG